ncbi:MAG TPA: FAD-dependent oxidoreductase [Gemmatimonadales bacterium]|jgi:NADPH-dependent 2,4-dienoyl-CoA reductase/sulfur reductase-like enzyme/nitrite reductase/ring-hydroxylating ferredoxin subunit
MSSDDQKPSGPDLREGVAADRVAEGACLAGQVDGEAVLLARAGGEWFAIGAACSHYSGPLPEGIIVGDTVRCPWHHACFSLRTGKPLRPPALRPLDRWIVEARDGHVRVTGKAPSSAFRARPAPVRPESVVIVGGGAAGDSAAATLREEGYEGPITIVDPDESAPYDRPNCSKDYLAGSAPEEWLPLRAPEYDRDVGITRMSGRRATELRAGPQEVGLDDGRSVSYRGGALLLATGASPIRLDDDVAGRDVSVHYLRSLADSRAIIVAASSARRAVVLGASFIGLEVAASLRARGLEVHVVAPDARPLERVMGPELGDFIRALHEEHGVIFHLESKAKKIGQGRVVLEAGDTLVTDLVVAGIGVRPNLDLAASAGLTLDRGLAVNEFLETSALGVFAAGDIARWPDPHSGDRIRVEHWVVAQRQGQTAARNILGLGQRFDAVPFFWSQHYDVPINYVGHAERWDAIEVEGAIAERDCVVRYRRGKKILAAATIYRDRESLTLELGMEQAGRRGS